MKILQIVPELNVGGVETGTVDMAKYLIGHGHKPVVVSAGGLLVEELQKYGVKHYQLPVHKKSLWTVVPAVKALAEIIRKEQVDIVHARSRVPAWIAFFACRRTKTPFITTCHGYYRKHLFSRVMGWPKLIIVPSQVIGRHMIEDFGVAPPNIRLIARSVDLEKFRALKPERPKNEYIVSIIGRITPLKGHEYFLKAMAKVLRNIPNIKIWVIGDVPPEKAAYKEELQILVKRLGLVEYVEFLGHRKDVPQLLAKTHCLVLSTVTEEAFGRVILEAQAAGVPVVATKVGGVVDIIDEGRTGLLVLPKDPEGMAQAVVKLLRDKNLAARIAHEAKVKLESKFTLEHMASQTVAVYEELLRSLRILVIKLSSMGDVVLVTASLKAIRKKFPNAQIDCLVGKSSSEILRHCPYIDGLVVYDPEHKDRGYGGLYKLAEKLRQSKYDKVIDFQNNIRSHLLAFLSFSQETFGYDYGKLGFLLSRAIRFSEETKALPPVEHQFQVLKMLDIKMPAQPSLELWPAQDDETYVRGLLESEWLGNVDKVVGINLSASERWKTKNWPLSYIAQLCDLCAHKGWRVLMTGQQRDLEAAREILQMTKAKPANFVGKTDIMQLAALIKHCKVFITPDSAPMHLAAAVATPFIALFGPTDSQRHLPPAKEFVVLKKDLSCAPCYSSHCRVLNHACMNQITPQEVMAQVEKFMRIEP